MIKTESWLVVVALSTWIGFSSTPSLAQQPTAEQRSACTGDTLKLCASEIPNTTRIIKCLARQKSQVSPRCRAFFDRAGL